LMCLAYSSLTLNSKMQNSQYDEFRCISLPIKEIPPIFHCPKLDKLITPCIRQGHIIEITGKAGAGKTQIVLSICAGTAWQKVLDCPKTEPGTINVSEVIIIISTEGPFPITRLNEMVMNLYETTDIMDKILIEEAPDLSLFFDCLENRIPQMAAHNNIVLIVIDSIAGPLRSEYMGDNWKERTATLHKVGSIISTLARNLKIPIVIVNQVTAYIDQPYESFDRSVVPCFGIALSNYIHTRIFVTRTDKMIRKTEHEKENDKNEEKINANTRIRTLTIDFSPLLPSGIPIHFVINKRGVRGVNIIE